MEMKSYVAWIRHARTGASFRVVVQAETLLDATLMVESQYGAENVIHPPMSL
jgi:hypothetical protein